MTLDLFSPQPALPSHSHNNRQSEMLYEKYLQHFGDQDKNTYLHLMEGKHIDPDMAFSLYEIRHLARRICTVRKHIGKLLNDEDELVHSDTSP